MFGRHKKNKPGIKTVFGAGENGGPANVFDSGSDMFSVTGTGDHDGTYFKIGDNMVSGPDGIHTVIGNGSVKTVFDPDGSSHTFFDNGSNGSMF